MAAEPRNPSGRTERVVRALRMVAEQTGAPETDALVMLSAHAERCDATLEEVALDVILGRVRFEQ